MEHYHPSTPLLETAGDSAQTLASLRGVDPQRIYSSNEQLLRESETFIGMTPSNITSFAGK